MQILYQIVDWIWGRKWRLPRADFEENPREVGWLGAIYLGYKYYFKPHRKGEGDIENYFRNQNLVFGQLPKQEIAQTISVSVGGDLMPYEWIKPSATEHLWDDIGADFFDADLVVANLETPIYRAKAANYVPELMLSDMYFNGSEEMFDIFSGNGKYKGYDVLSIANNHSMDMGEEGLVDTMHFLRERNITYAGGALSEKEQQQPVIVERKGVKFAFLAWTANLNQLLPPDDKPFIVNYLRLNVADIDLSPIVVQAKAARTAGADVIITMLHVGNAYQAYPSAHTVDNFHRLFEATGTDVILGYHPHNPQPMEKFAFTDPFSGESKAGFAIYSMADFVAYDIFVWDRLLPLLKLYFQQSTLTGKCRLSQVEVTLGYMWGSKFPKVGEEQLRILNLKKLLAQIKNGQAPDFMDELSQQEALHLEWFAARYLLPNV